MAAAKKAPTRASTGAGKKTAGVAKAPARKAAVPQQAAAKKAAPQQIGSKKAAPQRAVSKHAAPQRAGPEVYFFSAWGIYVGRNMVAAINE